MGRWGDELNEYKRELSSIIKELEYVEYHVRHDFKNVGNVQCADSIRSVINKYKSALSTLNSIEPTLLDRLLEEAKRKAAEVARKAALKNQSKTSNTKSKSTSKPKKKRK